MGPPDKSEAVKVVVRCRPLNSKEKGDNRAVIVEMETDSGTIKVTNPKADGEPPKLFTFDQVYDMTTKQRDLFDITARPLIDSCAEGYNGTIFAYGQTGTGKSFTMEGVFDNAELQGIIPNTFDYVFEVIGKQSGQKEFLVRASYLEIYNEDIRDLLSKTPDNKLELKETPDHGVYVKDLMQFVVKSVPELRNVLAVGKKNRSVGSTLMNQDSSRSHSIFTITVEVVEKLTAGNAKDESHIRVGKCNLVDLAGSERQSKTGATGDRLKEGIKINQSLSALGNVISALVDGKSGHVPYRDSKLTRLLQDSLGGNTKTVMVANIGPADWNFDETMSTLRYANRAKNIKNKPRINEDPKDAMLREFQEEINRLKDELAARTGGGVPGGGGGGGVRVKEVEKVVEVEDDVTAVKERLRKELEEKMTADISHEAVEKAKKEAAEQARKALESIAADGNKTEAMRKKARDALRKQAAEAEAIAGAITKEREEKDSLERKIKEWESKVLQGGVNLIDKVDELKKRSADAKRELEIRRRQEAEQKRQLAEMEAEQQLTQEKFSSLAEEVEVKSKQLKKLFEKYQAKKAETTGLQEQFQREREGLLEDYRILTQQIKLKNLIIACFIPPDYQDRIMQHCHWLDYDSTWSIDGLSYAGNSIRAHQEIQAQQERDGLTGDSDLDKLANVYFTYAAGEEGEGGMVPAAHAGRKVATGVRSSAQKKGKGKDPTNIGDLRDSVHYNKDDAGNEKAFPKARGIVKDTVDPRLRKSVAK